MNRKSTTGFVERASFTHTVPPGPRGHKLFGSLGVIRRDRIRFVTEATRDYGDIVAFTMPFRRLFLLRHPDHIRHVLIHNQANYRKGLGLEHAKNLLGAGLLTSEGAEWAEQRRRMNPAFAQELDGDRFVRKTAMLVGSMLRSWRAAPGPVDVARDLTLLGIRVVGSTVLGCDFADSAAAIADDLRTLTDYAMKSMTAILPIPAAFMSRRARKALRRLDGIVEDLLAGDTTSIVSSDDGFRQARDHLLTVLFAGHETTAATLSWACHLLAPRPDVQARLAAEADRVLGARLPAASDAIHLRYTTMVLHETLRLYPPVWLIPRRNIATDAIGGYAIPAGSDVLTSIYSLHRHPDFWPNPDEFSPERFENGAGDCPAFMPFGVGPRSCIGRRLGTLETTLILSLIVREFRLEPVSGHVVRAAASLTLHPDSGVWLRPVPRHPQKA